MRLGLGILFCALVPLAKAQVSTSVNKSYVFAKEYSKDKTLYYAKEFLFRSVIGCEETPKKFTMDALTAATSGELTALSYKVAGEGKSGLVFGFWGNYWNTAGTLYQGYGFYHLTETEAVELVDKIQQLVDNSRSYLLEDQNNNNIIFKYKELEFLIYFDGTTKIRLFWEDFDSEWLFTEFKRTKKRFEKKMD